MTDNNNTNILQTFNTIAVKQYLDRLRIFTSKLDDALFRLAEKSDSNSDISLMFEARSMLKNHGNVLAEKAHNNFSIRLLNPNKQFSSFQSNNDQTKELSLMNEAIYEQWLDMEIIIRNGEKSNFQSLLCLEKRYREINPALENNLAAPISVANICHSFKDALLEIDPDMSALPIIYRLFDTIFVIDLGEFFDSLNNFLEQNGVLPNLETNILGELFKSQVKPTQARRSQDTPADTEASDAKPVHETSAESTFDAVNDMLSLTRYENFRTGGKQGIEISIEDVEKALQKLQNDPAVMDSIYDGANLEQWLGSELGIQNHQSIAPPTIGNKITLIDQLFTLIKKDAKIGEELRIAIQKLQIPVTRTALQEDDFFVDPNNACRIFLDKITALCEKTDSSNKLISNDIQNIVKALCKNENPSQEDFATANNSLDALEQRQNEVYQRNVGRLRESFDNSKRIKQAKIASQKAIKSLLPKSRIPDALLELVNPLWIDVLFSSYLTSGPKSDNWHSAILIISNVKDRLIRDIHDSTLPSTELLNSVEQRLRATFPDDLRVDNAMAKLRHAISSPENIVPLQIPSSLFNDLDSERRRDASVNAVPNLNPWIRRAKSLKAGDRLSYIDTIDQAELELIWKDDNGKFIFVNQLGQKQLELDILETAMEMKRGLYPIEENANLPIVDQGLFASVKRVYNQLNEAHQIDELTGLPNRKELKKAIERITDTNINSDSSGCLLYIDIDEFSLINETYGHNFGDQCIVAIADTLSTLTEFDGLSSRLLGNEFAVLIPNSDIKRAMDTAESLRSTIEKNAFNFESRTVNLSVSIGAICLSEHTENTADFILTAARSACSEAKNAGKNCSKMYRKSDLSIHKRQQMLSLIDTLQAAKPGAGDQLLLRGQPIVSTAFKDVAPHYEILLAIKSDNGQVSSPVEFIQVAESHNRMQIVDRWVIDQAFAWIEAMMPLTDNLPHLSINLSGNSIKDDRSIGYIREKFHQYSIPPENICFEVTETATIGDLTQAANYLRELKQLGCALSLDDFGTGYSSYEYLKQLPFDFLKIDGSFIKEICWNTEDEAMVKSMNEIAHILSMETIAECVENAAIERSVRALGIDYMQGYGISRPIPLHDILGAAKSGS